MDQKDPEFINFTEVDSDLQMETLTWRNSPQVTPFFQLQNISADTHKRWLASLQQQDPSNIAFLIRYDSANVGVTYFTKVDRSAKVCDWGIYLHRTEFRGLGLAQKSLAFCIDFASKQLGMTAMKLEVLKSNATAMHVYEKLGFVAEQEQQRDTEIIVSMKRSLV